MGQFKVTLTVYPRDGGTARSLEAPQEIDALIAENEGLTVEAVQARYPGLVRRA